MDYGYESALSDWHDERESLLEAFGSFFSGIVALDQAIAMVIMADFRIPDTRLHEFGAELLDGLSLTRKASLLSRIMEECGCAASKELPKAIKEVAAFRNELAHQSLDFRIHNPLRESPVLLKARAYGGDPGAPLTADELHHQIARLHVLTERVLSILPTVIGDE